jgi:hypothetical protein
VGEAAMMRKGGCQVASVCGLPAEQVRCSRQGLHGQKRLSDLLPASRAALYCLLGKQ